MSTYPPGPCRIYYREQPTQSVIRSEDADGVTFLRYETKPVTYAIFAVSAGEIRLSHGRVALRQLSMLQRGDACPETTKAIENWPDKKGQDDDRE